MTNLNLNGWKLNDAQTVSFKLALGMAQLNLETIPREKMLDGLPVAEHLANLREIVKFTL